MHTIQVSVRDKIATQTDGTVIINGNSDYNIEFDFDAEWADLNNKIGIFAYNDAAAHKWAYQTVMFSGNTCTVPILRDIHCVYVGVTAGNVRVTTPAKVQCRLSISDYADTEEPPSADVWGQILAKLDELQAEIDEIKEGGGGATLSHKLTFTGSTNAVFDGTEDVTVDIPAVEVSDEQIASAVDDWLNTHPDATTTVADGSITEAKLSDGLFERVTGDARHRLTEVKVTPIPQSSAWTKANYDGTVYKAAAVFFTPFTKTPRYVKVVNKMSDKEVKLSFSNQTFRFANGSDEAADGFETNNGNRNLQFFKSLTVAAGETLLYDLQEYGRKGCEYFQHIVVGKPIGGKYTDSQFSELLSEQVEVYYVYDSYTPTYTAPPDDGEFTYDLPVRFSAQGINNTATTYGYAVVPYYPDTVYSIRGGTYVNINYNSLECFYLLDDAIFNGRDKGIGFNSADCGHIPLIKGIFTTQYDTSVNGGKDPKYQWAHIKTPPISDLTGVKYIAIPMMVISQDDATDKGSEFYKAIFDKKNAEGIGNLYVTRFARQVERSLYAQLVLPNPNYYDDGSKLSSMFCAAGTSPLASATWVLFGDSLTDNYGGHDYTGKYFATKIAREFSMSIDNRAKSGSNIYRGGSGNYVNVSGMIKLDELISEIESGTAEQPDYITIAFGTNSFAAQIGTNADTAENDTTVYGATKRFIEILREKCPQSVFGFVLSPKQDWGAADPSHVRAVDAARTAIKSVCDDYGVPYVDMSTQSGITVDMLPDGIHISNDQSQNLYYHAMRRFVMGL